MTAPQQAQAAASAPRARSLVARAWGVVQFLLALALTGGALVYLILWPHAPEADEADEHARPPQVVRVAGSGLIAIQPDSTLAQKLKVEVVQKVSVQAAALNVTGTVVASMRPGREKGRDYWQFNTPELLTTHTDWLKARDDITFTEAQLVKVRDLADSRIKAQKELVARLEKSVDAGVDARKELIAETNNLKQLRITTDKEVHEAGNAVKLARRTEAALARQLQQAGLEPKLLLTATADMEIVQGDVPEARLRDVWVGQRCEARFFGLPQEKPFKGKVTSITPVVSKERRTLRVLFVLDDPKDLLRPGMFAEIGLGTDPRQVVLIPADAVVHIARSDYVLVGADGGNWKVVEVKVGEQHGQRVEIVDGLHPGERVVTQGAILLKPAAARSLLPGAVAERGDR